MPDQAAAEGHELARRQVRVDVRVLREEAHARHRVGRGDAPRRRWSTGRDVGAMSPVSILIVVVLPAPFGPRNPKTSPSSTSKLTPLTASHLLAGERLAEGLGELVDAEDGNVSLAHASRPSGAPVARLAFDRDGRERRRLARRPVLVQLVLDLAGRDPEHERRLRRRPARRPRASSGWRSARAPRSSRRGWSAGRPLRGGHDARRQVAHVDAGPSQSTTARSIAFSSSRTLPGHR